MAAYLDNAGFKTRTIMPGGDVDLLNSSSDSTGFIAARLVLRQSEIDSRLRKRYAVPFALPAPEIVCGWLAAFVTLDAYLKRGVNPQDPTLDLVKADYERAEKQLAEAADSVTGLFDLPLREDAQTSGVTQGGPFGYSEQSPYTWADLQRQAASQEDGNGR